MGRGEETHAPRPTHYSVRTPIRTTVTQTLRLASVLALAALSAAPALAQGTVDRDHVPSEERVDLFQRRQTDLDANQIRTTVFNYGITGRISGEPGDGIAFEWPKNTRRLYIALVGLLAGAEVTGESGDREYIVDVPLRAADDTNDRNDAFTWAPVSGYVNPADVAFGVARSDSPETWPSFWPDKLEDPTDPGWAGSWSGYFGKDVFNADLEVYYKMGDDQYARTTNTYYPDSTDRSRRGLGLLAETRVLAWSQVLIEDVSFILSSIKNDGTQDLDKVGVTLWLADFVGGDDGAADDRPFFNLLLDTAFLTDGDGRGDPRVFGSERVGAAIAYFLESPGNAVDRIDNDGDGTTADSASELNELGLSTGEPGSPIITPDFLAGEGDQVGAAGLRLRFDGIDNNGNGLVDEDSSRTNFGLQAGVGYADRIDNDGDGEPGSPVVTEDMVALAAGDRWNRWPTLPAAYNGEPVHLVGVGPEDLGRAYRDNIDNDGDALGGRPPDFLWEPGSPVVTQEMVTAAAGDAPYFRFAVPGTQIILYDVRASDVGRPYADGVDNDGDGAVDEGIDENIDEMIDERRDDGIDNDGDWRASLDDVGLDGSPLTNDRGEGDGVPTSGAGTDFPGETNVDVTDISESDQIGITNAQYRREGSVNFGQGQDERLFREFFVPGQFELLRPTSVPTAPNDLFVSSGTFPLAAGQTERVSVAVILGEVDYSVAIADDLGAIRARYRDLFTKRQNASEAYEADYRFAQAPVCPTVRAVPGDGNVTLYWDDAAERSFDSFIADLDVPGLDPNDFEGYRVYRSTDAAFLDSRVITDGFGNSSFLRPIAQFDLIDGFGGFSEIAVDGTQFYLGNNIRDDGEAANGLSQTFTDETAVNGVTYFYAVTSYDFGAPSVNIPPTECAISITINPDGSVGRLGSNIVVATPSQLAAGYTEGTADLRQTRGLATGTIGFEVIDPTALENGHSYRVTFQDTLKLGTLNASGRQTTPDTIATKSFTLRDLTDDEIVLDESITWRPGLQAPITEGFRLLFDPVTRVGIVDEETGWVQQPDSAIRALEVSAFDVSGNQPGTRVPSDYRIVMGPPGFGMSTEFSFRSGGVPRTIPAKPANFRVFKTTVDADGAPVEVPVAFAFFDGIGPGAEPFGVGTAATNLWSSDPDFLNVGDSDRIYVLEDIPGDRNAGLTATWQFRLNISPANRDRRDPREGDVGFLRTTKPFLDTDVFEFTVSGPTFDASAGETLLDDVRVVPNPYRGSSAFETANPFPTGRGERRIRFINLPPRATVRVFTVSGRLVRTLEHNAGSNDGLTAAQLRNGSLTWDLLNEENLEVSYGVYLYHVEAPGVGDTTGTLALIK